jgi:hypothetical protein
VAKHLHRLAQAIANETAQDGSQVTVFGLVVDGETANDDGVGQTLPPALLP